MVLVCSPRRGAGRLSVGVSADCLRGMAASMKDGAVAAQGVPQVQGHAAQALTAAA